MRFADSTIGHISRFLSKSTVRNRRKATIWLPNTNRLFSYKAPLFTDNARRYAKLNFFSPISLSRWPLQLTDMKCLLETRRDRDNFVRAPKNIRDIIYITVERTSSYSCSIRFCPRTTRLGGWVVSVSDHLLQDRLHLRGNFSSFFLDRALSLKYTSEHRRGTSVAEWLALLRYQWWCLDSVRGSWFKSAIKFRGHPRKITRRSLESGRMSNTSPQSRWQDNLPGLSSDELRVRR